MDESQVSVTSQALNDLTLKLILYRYQVILKKAVKGWTIYTQKKMSKYKMNAFAMIYWKRLLMKKTFGQFKKLKKIINLTKQKKQKQILLHQENHKKKILLIFIRQLNSMVCSRKKKMKQLILADIFHRRYYLKKVLQSFSTYLRSYRLRTHEILRQCKQKTVQKLFDALYWCNCEITSQVELFINHTKKVTLRKCFRELVQRKNKYQQVILWMKNKRLVKCKMLMAQLVRQATIFKIHRKYKNVLLTKLRNKIFYSWNAKVLSKRKRDDIGFAINQKHNKSLIKLALEHWGRETLEFRKFHAQKNLMRAKKLKKIFFSWNNLIKQHTQNELLLKKFKNKKKMAIFLTLIRNKDLMQNIRFFKISNNFKKHKSYFCAFKQIITNRDIKLKAKYHYNSKIMLKIWHRLFRNVGLVADFKKKKALQYKKIFFYRWTSFRINFKMKSVKFLNIVIKFFKRKGLRLLSNNARESSNSAKAAHHWLQSLFNGWQAATKKTLHSKLVQKQFKLLSAHQWSVFRKKKFLNI